MIVLGAGAGWAFLRYRALRRAQPQPPQETANVTNGLDSDAWYRAVELAKAERSADLGGGLEVPPELKHYEERYWFLATQVAEIEKYNVHTCQDYLDLAALIERGELIPVPAVTESYVLLGIGQRADDSEFSKYQDDNQNSAPPTETQPADFSALQKLAQSFNGRSYNLDLPADRLALKMNMLSVVRPEALRVMEEVAAAYKSQFNRPLPISSLMRPEQYQHSLRRVNRNAVLIDSPPHTTGLAFDIDYRYMSAAEQNFVMKELARMKNEGRIEVIRERNANYHVFVFLKGSRPSDDLVTASLEKAGAPPPEEETNHATVPTVKSKTKLTSKRAKVTRAQATRRPNSVKKTRKRRH